MDDLNKQIQSVNESVKSFNTQSGARLPTLSAINSESLNGQQPVTIPPAPPETAAGGISGLAEVVKEQTRLAQEQERKAQEAQAAVSTEKGKLQGLMERVLGVQESRARLEQEAGLGVKQQKVTDYTNQLEGLERAELNEIRALDNQFMSAEGKNAAVREISRRYAFQKADVALLQSAANRDLDTASRIIDRKIALQLEPLQTQLEFTKLFYQENRDLFSKADDRAFQTRIKQLDQEYETTKENRTAIANLQLEALKNGVMIPASVMAELNKAKDAAEATQILARSGISLQDPLEREGLQLRNQALRADLASEGGGASTVTPGGQVQPSKQTILEQLIGSTTQGAEADGVYTDPNLYARLRASVKMKPGDFDARYGYLVNPASRGRLNIKSAVESGLKFEDL